MNSVTSLVLLENRAEYAVFQCTVCGESWNHYNEADAPHDCPKEGEEEFAWLDEE